MAECTAPSSKGKGAGKSGGGKDPKADTTQTKGGDKSSPKGTAQAQQAEAETVAPQTLASVQTWLGDPAQDDDDKGFLVDVLPLSVYEYRCEMILPSAALASVGGMSENTLLA